MNVYQTVSNFKSAAHTENTTSWRILATDGSTYDTLANLVAAGKTAFPGLGAGGFVTFLQLASHDGSGAAGSGYYYRVDGSTAPSDLSAARFASGEKDEPGNVQYLWLKKTTGTNTIIATVGW